MPETLPHAPAPTPANASDSTPGPASETTPAAPVQTAADTTIDAAGAEASGEAAQAASDESHADHTQVESAQAATPGSGAAPLNPAEVAQSLKSLFPALFSGQVKPLKLRIQVDIQERAPGKFTKQALSAFFRRHTGSTSYLMAVAKAPHRFDLDGQPAGEIADEHRKVAQDELARRRGNQESRRELEEQQRRNRAGLLHDFQITTLTKANFCALKGLPVNELDGLLEIAKGEAEERSRQMAMHAQQRPADRTHERGANDRGAPRSQTPHGQERQRPSNDRNRRPGPPGAGGGPRRPR